MINEIGTAMIYVMKRDHIERVCHVDYELLDKAYVMACAPNNGWYGEFRKRSKAGIHFFTNYMLNELDRDERFEKHWEQVDACYDRNGKTHKRRVKRRYYTIRIDENA